MISISLIGVGLIFVFVSKGIAKLIFDAQAKYLGTVIGGLLKSHQSVVIKIYRIAIVIAGLLALLGAYGAAFGPIYI